MNVAPAKCVPVDWARARNQLLPQGDPHAASDPRRPRRFEAVCEYLIMRPWSASNTAMPSGRRRTGPRGLCEQHFGTHDLAYQRR